MVSSICAIFGFNGSHQRLLCQSTLHCVFLDEAPYQCNLIEVENKSNKYILMIFNLMNCSILRTNMKKCCWDPCWGTVDGMGCQPWPHSTNICCYFAKIIAFTGNWLNLTHPSHNCFLWVFMKNAWDLGIIELYPSKAKHLLKDKKKKKKNYDRMVMGCCASILAYFQLKLR